MKRAYVAMPESLSQEKKFLQISEIQRVRRFLQVTMLIQLTTSIYVKSILSINLKTYGKIKTNLNASIHDSTKLVYKTPFYTFNYLSLGKLDFES